MNSQLRRYTSYVVPSLLAFALSGVYIIVDGFFVGNSVGDIGLSAINMVYPVVSLMQALGTGIGMGGGVLYAIHRASGQEQRARDNIQGTLLLLLISSFLITGIFLPTLDFWLKFFGARGELAVVGKEYLLVVVSGAVFQIFGVGVVPLIRNNEGASFAMFSMIGGFVINIVLDYLFIWCWNWALYGAGAATIIGQAVTMVMGLGFLWWKKLPVIGIPESGFKDMSWRIVKIGIAPFGATMCPIISVVFMNRASITYGGETAVAIFACISYVLSVAYLLFQGVGDGSQPLMSEAYGHKDYRSLLSILKLTFVFAVLVSSVCVGLLFILREEVGILFGASNAVQDGIIQVMPIFLVGLPFVAIGRVVAALFYATEYTFRSYIVVYGEPLLISIMINILPRLYGQSAVWWSEVLAQILVGIAAIVLLLGSRMKREEKW